MPTEAAERALAILRDGSPYQWYVGAIFAVDAVAVVLFGPVLGWI